MPNIILYGQDALNKQTFGQFRSYAEQQCPGNPDQQGLLVRQLQEQHYYQYMQRWARSFGFWQQLNPNFDITAAYCNPGSTPSKAPAGVAGRWRAGASR